MTDRIDELQWLHEAATKEPWSYDRCKRKQGTGRYSVLGPDGGCILWENYHGDADIEGDDDDVDLILAMRNALPALLRVARAAQQLRKAMTTPPKGYSDEHQGYWWTGATEKAAEEVAKAVDQLETP